MLAYILLLAFVPFVLMIFYLWHYCSSSFAEVIRGASLESYKTKARQIELYMEDFLQIMDSILEDEDLGEILQNECNESLTAYRINHLISKYAVGLHSDIAGIYFLSGHGKEYVINYYPREYYLSVRNEMKQNYIPLKKIASAGVLDESLFTGLCRFREMPCIAVSSGIYDENGELCGKAVFLVKLEHLEEIAQQTAKEGMPWGFSLAYGDEILCADEWYDKLLENGEMESCIIPMLEWKFSCVVDTRQIQQQAFRKFASMLFLVILICILIMYVITRAVNQQLRTLHSLQREMERVSKEGTYRTIAPPACREMDSLFNGYNRMVEKISSQEQMIRRQNEENIHRMAMQKTAELKAMELEINPHYLYNTLNCISGTAIEHKDYQVSRMLKIFSMNLRYILKDRYQAVPIYRDIQWLKDYLTLQKERYGDKFNYELDVAPETEPLLIYKMLLQPFVENSILHGFGGVQSGGMLTILLYLEDGNIVIQIYDNGQGIEEKTLEGIRDIISNPMRETSTGLGIQNSLRRMQGYYGNGYHIQISSSLQEGSVVKIVLPVIKE